MRHRPLEDPWPPRLVEEVASAIRANQSDTRQAARAALVIIALRWAMPLRRVPQHDRRRIR